MPVETQILIDLKDFTLNRLLPLVAIIIVVVVFIRVWRGKRRG